MNLLEFFESSDNDDGETLLLLDQHQQDLFDRMRDDVFGRLPQKFKDAIARVSIVPDDFDGEFICDNPDTLFFYRKYYCKTCHENMVGAFQSQKIHSSQTSTTIQNITYPFLSKAIHYCLKCCTFQSHPAIEKN